MATTASLSSSNAPENMQRHLRLLAASVSGNEARVRAVLAEEQWPTAADLDTLRQALVKAATKGNQKILRLLLDSGAEIHPRKDNEVSPLFKAAEAGHAEVVSLLLERRAYANWQYKNGQTALFRAAEGGHLKVVTRLLQSGADPNVRAKNGQVALHLACLRGHNLVVEALLNGGADPDGGRGKDKRPGDRDGRTPVLFIASEKSSKWNLDTVKLLLQKGADPDARDSTERTPLHWAATNGYLDLGHTLLAGSYQSKPNINATQNRGKTALHFASLHNREDFVELLISHKALLDPQSDGQWTPLINASDKGHVGVVSRLLAAGANVNAQTSNHMTALHWAASNGHEDVVQILLGRPEANLAIKDNDERTPMICAAEGRHNRIVSMLSPARHAHRLSESAREATKRFEATIVDFGEFQEMKWQKRDVSQKKPQLVFHPTVFDLLYGWDEKEDKPTVPILTKNPQIKWKPRFRWIHLPANNIAWIETLLAKSFIEGGHRDVEGYKALGKCFDQEHRGPMAHANFMRTYCHRVPSTKSENDDRSGLNSLVEQAGERESASDQAGIESQPTDLSENSIGRGDAARKKGRSEQIAERHPQRAKRKKGNPGNPPGTKEARLSSRQPSFANKEAFQQLVNNGKMVLFMPFLHYETHQRRMSMTTTIESARKGLRPRSNASRDELLVHAYWKGQLHMRRTLDQYFYHGIDTTQRDSDQVVWRYCDKFRRPEEPKVFMVDQLWMWILGGDTVITCFPQRWDQPKQDPLNVVDGIIAETSAKTRRETPIQSVYDLAMVITNRCAGMFDRHRVDDQQFQFLDMFESSIGSVTDEEGKLFSKFKAASEESTKWLHRRRRGSKGQQIEHEFSDDLLNIHQETRLLVEIKDIQDELAILNTVLHSQALALSDLQKNIEEELRTEGAPRKATDLVLKDIRRRFQEQLHLLTVHRDDIYRMSDQTKDIYNNLTNLLDLKQKHSNALEARFAREQALAAAKQGQTIMVFTIVTIIFLPMSFIASFFAIEFQDWGDRLTIGYVSRYMFPIGLAISFIFVAAAFLVDDISDAYKSGTRRVRQKLAALSSNDGSISRKIAISRSDSIARDSLRGNEKEWDARWTHGAGAGTWRSIAEDMESKPRGRERIVRKSIDRDRYRMPSLGFSPGRQGGNPWVRPSLDGWRERFSGDVERGRDSGRMP